MNNNNNLPNLGYPVESNESCRTLKIVVFSIILVLGVLLSLFVFLPFILMGPFMIAMGLTFFADGGGILLLYMTAIFLFSLIMLILGIRKSYISYKSKNINMYCVWASVPLVCSTITLLMFAFVKSILWFVP